MSQRITNCWQCQLQTEGYDTYRLTIGPHAHKAENKVLGFFCTIECLSKWVADNWHLLITQEQTDTLE